MIAQIRRLPILAFTVSFTLLLVRGWPRLQRAQLWAEDSMPFLKEVLEHSLGAFTHATGGYFQTIPRMILYLGNAAIPFVWLPQFVFLICGIITAAVFAQISSQDYRWIIPSDRVRFGLSVLLCLSPGFTDMLGNTANLYAILLLWLGLLGLKEGRIARLEWIFAILVIASVGVSFLFLPLFAYRATKERCRASWGLIALMVAMFLLTIGLPRLSDGRTAVPPDAQMLIEGFSTLIFGQFLLHPWLGNFLTSRLIQNSSGIFFVLGAIALCASILLGRRVPTRKALTALLLFEAGILFVPFITWFVRPGTLSFYQFKGMTTFFWDIRYSFLVAAGGLFFWAGLLRKERFTMGFLLMAFYGLLHKSEFTVQAYGCKSRWEDAALKIDQARKIKSHERILIPACPEPYSFNYTP